jgi:hypothetical protein
MKRGRSANRRLPLPEEPAIPVVESELPPTTTKRSQAFRIAGHEGLLEIRSLHPRIEQAGTHPFDRHPVHEEDTLASAMTPSERDTS